MKHRHKWAVFHFNSCNIGINIDYIVVCVRPVVSSTGHIGENGIRTFYQPCRGPTDRRKERGVPLEYVYITNAHANQDLQHKYYTLYVNIKKTTIRAMSFADDKDCRPYHDQNE